MIYIVRDYIISNCLKKSYIASAKNRHEAECGVNDYYLSEQRLNCYDDLI